MRNKGWLITAGVLTVLGICLFGGALTMAKGDFSRFSTARYETNEYTVTEEYQSVRVTGNTAEVTFVPSADGKTAVHCFEDAKMRHAVSVEDDTLTVTVNDTRRWYEHIGFFFRTPRITVYLPRGAYDALAVTTNTGKVTVPADFTFRTVGITGRTGDVNYAAPATGDVTLQTTTGHVEVQNVSVGGLSLAVSTGNVTVAGVACDGELAVQVSTGKTRLTDVTCETLTSTGDTGDLALENVIVRGRLTAKRDTGDVLLTRCDAAALSITTDTGDVKGSLLSAKIFFASTDTGRVDVPKTTTGGRCEITTDTGDIRMEITQ